MTISPSKPEAFSADGVAPGKYFLQFKKNGVAPTTRSIVVK
jgi:hypothetical protein